MNIGSLLKQTRKRLGLTQQEMAGNVLSYSYYSKIERGIHDINVNDLIKILDLHKIDIHSFFKTVENNSSLQYRKLYIRKLKSYYYKSKVDAIKSLQKQIKQSTNLHKVDKSYLIAISMEMIAICENDFSLIDSNIKNTLKKIIFSFDSWSKDALEIFVMSMPVFDEKELEYLINLIYKKTKPFSSHTTEDQILLACIPVNYFHISILRNYESKVTFNICNNILNELPQIEATGLYRIEGQYLKANIDNDHVIQKKIISCLQVCNMNNLIERLRNV